MNLGMLLGSDKENVYHSNVDNNIVYFKTGDENEITLPDIIDELINQPKNSLTFVHNHTNRSLFSAEDIIHFIKYSAIYDAVLFTAPNIGRFYYIQKSLNKKYGMFFEEEILLLYNKITQELLSENNLLNKNMKIEDENLVAFLENKDVSEAFIFDVTKRFFYAVCEKYDFTTYIKEV